jgi:hypothetical protein
MAGKIYKNQTALRIRMKCGVEVTGASALIKYAKPPDKTDLIGVVSRVTGSWEAYVGTGHGLIYYDVQNESDLDVSGRWKFWPFIMFPGGTRAPGSVHYETVHEEGE